MSKSKSIVKRRIKYNENICSVRGNLEHYSSGVGLQNLLDLD